jgi:hypothetical protein
VVATGAATADHGPTSGQASRPNPCKWNDINLLLDVVRMLLFAAECLAAVIRHVFSPSPGATAGSSTHTLRTRRRAVGRARAASTAAAALSAARCAAE